MMMRPAALHFTFSTLNSSPDGDGLANDIDPSPMQYDGDFFGTSVAWYNANCSGVMQAATNALGETEMTWNASTNPDAYYWLDLSATGVLGVTTIRVTCDGPSDLGDMTIIARTNMVCHIPMLAGATYMIESDLPFDGVSASDNRVQIQPMELNGKHGLHVEFPIECSFPAQGSGAFYELATAPIDIGAELVSVTGGCCNCSASTNGFSWTCNGGCGGGGHDLWAVAAWEGYSKGFWWLANCPCQGVPEEPVASLVLDLPHVLFTNNNGGAEDSDIVDMSVGLVCDVPTNGMLRLDLYNPNLGIKVWSSSNRTGLVSFPLTWNVEDCAMTNFYVEGCESMPPGVNFLSLEWLDGERCVDAVTNDSFGVYCPVANVINNSLYDNGDLCNPSGIVVGTNACFAIEFTDFEPSAQDIEWSIIEGSASFVGGINHGKRVRVESSTPDQFVKMRVQVGDCRSRPIEMMAFVVEPLFVKLTVCIVGNDEGSYYACDAATVSNLVVGVNKIYEQIGVSFDIDSISYTNCTEWLNLSEGGHYLLKRQALTGIESNTGGLELYFTQFTKPRNRASENASGIVAAANVTGKTLAHEIGHAFRCADVYHVQKHDNAVFLQNRMACQSHCQLDWNNGTNCRYYRPGVNQDGLIVRLLMCGFDYNSALDMSMGSVHGYTVGNDEGLVDVGFFNNGFRRNLRLHR